MNVMPEEKTPLSCWNKVVVSPIQDLEERGLSKYAIYNIQINKEMHRTKGYIRISDGNHFVEMFPENGLIIQQLLFIIIRSEDILISKKSSARW